MDIGMNIHLVVASLEFPLWLRISHYINLLFIGLLIRSGIQILGAHPRLYWNDGCDPKTEWIKFTTKKVPTNELYTSTDDEEPVSPLLALPGKDNLGLGRHWHFFSAIFWLLNGIIYIILLFATGEWSRLIPTSWSVFPAAWHSLLTYLSLHVPPASEFQPYEPLQQLTYAAVVFLLAPFMLLTAAAMSPALEAQFPWYVKLFGGKQSARSLHFLSMILFVLFTIGHTFFVLVAYFQNNIRNIVLGDEHGSVTLAVIIAIIALALVAAIYAWTSWYTLRHKRRMQHALGTIINPTQKVLAHNDISRQNYKPSNISSYFWINGRPPEGEEYSRLSQNNFADWKLEVCGLVEQPLHLSLADLQALPKQSQTTEHNCIQGWTGIAEWSGVRVSEILQLCKPLSTAHYLVFTSYQLGKGAVKPELKEAREHTYYEVIDMELANHPQTILAYEMNGQALPVVHGAPLRLRVETQLGFKMVKYLRSIELVEDYSTVGQGQGGFREDFQYYSEGASI